MQFQIIFSHAFFGKLFMKSYANNEYFSIKMILSIHECNIDIIDCINDSFIAFICIYKL